MNRLIRLLSLSSVLVLSSLAAAQTVHAFLWTASGGMQDLGTLPGWDDSYGQGINRFGQVVGYNILSDGSAQTAFGWSSAIGMRFLSGVSRTESIAYGINDAKQVAGTSFKSKGLLRAFLWSAKSGALDLGDLGGGDSDALAINNSGTVVGYAPNADDVTRPFVWTQSAGMQDLISLTENCPTCNGIAWGVNDRGVVVGDIATKPNGAVTAFAWKNGHFRLLGMLGGRRGGRGSIATGINKSGQIVGFSTVASGAPHPFLWTNSGGMQDLGLLPNFAECFAYGINDSTQVVGYCVSEQTARAFLWTAATGMQDIGTLGGASAEAYAINNAGQVTGWAETQ